MSDKATRWVTEEVQKELLDATERMAHDIKALKIERDAALARVARLEAALRETVEVIDEYYFYNSSCHCNACTQVRGISERAHAALEAQP